MNYRSDNYERHLILIETMPLVNNKYTLGYNQVIQSAICEDVIYYPASGFFPISMFPSTLETNNKIYNVVPIIDSSKFLFSLAKRSGGFHFVDYPLEGFSQVIQIHKNMILDLDLDFNNSFFRCVDTALITAFPIVIPLYFKLKNTENEYN